MSIDVYWGSGSPFVWSVLLTLEHKGLAYNSHLLQFSQKEQKTPAMLKLNPRGKVPILKDGDFVVYESQAIMQYLDKKYPEKNIFGKSAEETAKIAQTISEITSYLSKPMVDTVRPFLLGPTEYKTEELLSHAEIVHKEYADFNARLKATPYLCGSTITAADLIFYPHARLLLRGLEKEAAQKINFGFHPLAEKYPSIAGWMKKIEAIPGYDKTFPPHWKQS